MIENFSNFFIILQIAETQRLAADTAYGSDSQAYTISSTSSRPGANQSLQAPDFQPLSLALVPSFIVNISSAQKSLSDLVRQPLARALTSQQISSEISQTQLSQAPAETPIHKITEEGATLESKVSPSLRSISYAIGEYEHKGHQFAAKSLQSVVDLPTKATLAIRQFSPDLEATISAIPKYMVPLTALSALTSLSAYQLTGSQKTPKTTNDTITSETDEQEPLDKESVTGTLAKQLGNTKDTVTDKLITLKPHALEAFGLANILPAIILAKTSQVKIGSVQPIGAASSVGSSLAKLQMTRASIQTKSPYSPEISVPSSRPPIFNIVQSFESPEKLHPNEKLEIGNQASSKSVEANSGIVESPARTQEKERSEGSTPAASTSVFDFGVYAALSTFIAQKNQTFGRMLNVIDEKRSLLNLKGNQAFTEAELPRTATQSLEMEVIGGVSPNSLVENEFSQQVQYKRPTVNLAVLATRTTSQVLQKQVRAKPLGTMVLAGVGTMIVNQLQSSLAAFKRETQSSADLFEEDVVSRSIIGALTPPVKAREIDEAREAGFEATKVLREQKRTELSLPSLVPSAPIIQDTINVSMSAETSENDLRELERKINRIISEQLNRYYGSTRL
jgi:hypothetical protein